MADVGEYICLVAENPDCGCARVIYEVHKPRCVLSSSPGSHRRATELESVRLTREGTRRNLPALATLSMRKGSTLLGHVDPGGGCL